MRPALIVAMLLFSPVLGVVVASSAGDISVEEADIQIVGNLENGASVTIEVTIHNAGSETASVYWEMSKDSSNIHEGSFISVAAGGTATTQTVTDLTAAGSMVITVDFSSDGIAASQSRTFTVADRPNLVIGSLLVDPPGPYYPGDSFSANVRVDNIGGASAAANSISFAIGEASPSEYPVSPLSPGQSVWINRTMSAPTADSALTVVVNSNQNDGVLESQTDDNEQTTQLVIQDPPNFFHDESGILVDTPISALTGPWTLSGTILRQGGSGSASVPLQFKRANDGPLVHSISVEFADGQASSAWTATLDDTMFLETEGEIMLDAVIDASGTLQEISTFDNKESFSIILYPEPNVVVSSLAVASPQQVKDGDPVTFTVSVQNVGSLTVIGEMSATFDGEPLTPIGRSIPAPSATESGSISIEFSGVARGDITREIPFTATWVANSNSYDSSTEDNTATGSVQLVSDLKIRFLSDESWSVDPPLRPNEVAVYSVTVTAQEGSGIETFVCRDQSTGVDLGTTVVNLPQVGDNDIVTCEVTPTQVGDLQLAIIALNGTVPSKTSVWTVAALTEEQIDPNEANRTLGFTLLIVLGLLGILALVAAVILTRRVIENTERETFDLCPACGGEIEGDEEACPYCDFELRKGFQKFHDCGNCGSPVPSSMDNCPYCGAGQEVSDHYEQRERRIIPIPEDEPEEEEDEDEIVVGTSDFGDQIQAFGVSEDAVEDDWEEGLESAEAQIRNIEEEYERNIAITEDDEMSEEIVETALQAQLESGRDLDSFLVEKGKRRALKDDEVELSASDANIRQDLYDLTGEQGVMPGEEVVYDELSDPSSQVGKEIDTDRVSDFSSLSAEAGHTEGLTDDSQSQEPENKPKRRRSLRRKEKSEGSEESQD
ncbi:MAG: CARDB domain-containing protein [Candidatus Thermoplasmatota archaeon]|nr:CARDB domain-containing protein [Candidatus Thermoplasmatota archaeon]